MNRQACVYRIINTITNDCYIGGTSNLYNRSATHKSFLKMHKHPNTKLQNSYNEYGEKAFRLEVLELVDDVSTLDDREQFYCDSLKPSLCTRTNVHDNSGIQFSEESRIKKSNSLKGRIITAEHRKKIGDANRGERSANYGKPAYNRGIPMSEEQKVKVAKAKSTVSDDIVNDIRCNYANGKRQCELMREYGLSKNIIRNIVIGRTYKYLLTGVTA